MKRPPPLLLLLLLLPAALCALGSAGRLHAEETFNAPAIRVNKQVIGIREVETLFADSANLIRDRLRRGELARRDLDAAIDMAWAESLETATQDAIMDQCADKRRREIMDMYLSRIGQNLSGERALQAFQRLEGDYVRELRRELVSAAGGEEELRAALKRRGQSMQDWESGLSRELFRRDVLAIELGPVNASPSYLRSYYQKHPELFRVEEAWRLRRIRIAKNKFSSPQVALEAAQLVVKKAREGADFSALAAKVSADPEFAAQGGLLARDGHTDLPTGNFPVEEKIADTLKDGEVSAPVDAGDFFLIVQRVGYRPAVVQTFEQASERVQALAYAEKLRAKKRELFERMKKDAYIEIMQKSPPPEFIERLRSELAPPRGEFAAPDK